MKKRNFILAMLIFGLGVSGGLPAKSQQSGQYYIPDELQGLVTPAMLDSMRTRLDSLPRTDLNIDYDSLGEFVWFGGAAENGYKILPNATNKAKVVTYTCMENGWIKSEAQFDTLAKTKDYDNHTACYDVSGNSFWTESIELSTVGSDSISVNTPVDVTVRIYEAYTITPPIAQFSASGNGISQSFYFPLESSSDYIVVFVNEDIDIVNIKRIGG